MTDPHSRLDLFRYRIERLRKRYKVRQLRRSGELARILEKSPYTYGHPGGMGHQTYDVVPKFGPVRQQDVLHMAGSEADAQLWIVDRFRTAQQRT